MREAPGTLQIPRLLRRPRCNHGSVTFNLTLFGWVLLKRRNPQPSRIQLGYNRLLLLTPEVLNVVHQSQAVHHCTRPQTARVLKPD